MNPKILILKGGPSSEFHVSLKTAKTVMNILKEHYFVKDCTIDNLGDWYLDGVNKRPENIIREYDFVFNAMHGEYGEDGTIQKLLETFGIPFNGSNSFSSGIAMNKALSKKIYKENGIKTPKGLLIENKNLNIDLDKLSIEIFRNFTMPVIIKPVDRGSSLDLFKANDYQSLFDILSLLFTKYDKLIVEEFIQGREATVGVIDDFRNQRNYSMMPIEIRKTGDLFDYDNKYNLNHLHISPGKFSREETEELQNIAAKAHQVLGLSDYSRSDFIVHPKRGIYLLETNSLPGLTENSLFPKSLDSVGSSLKEFFDHIIIKNLKRNN